MKALVRWSVAVLASAALWTAASNATASDTGEKSELGRLRQEVGELKARLELLEGKLKKLEASSQEPEEGRAEKEDQLEAELGKLLSPPPSPVAAASEEGGRKVTAISRSFNPAISINGLFTGGYLSRRDAWERLTGLEFDNGLNLQEVEARFTADVDPFLQADLTFTFDQSGNSEVEEAYVKVMRLPWGMLPSGLNLRAGKFLTTFGRHNLLHSHQWPFIDPPMVSSSLFSEEGINELGGEASYLLPLPWYSELTAGAFSGDNNRLFAGSEGRNRGAYLVHFKNFFDLSEETTLEVGQSYAAGRHFSPGNPWTQVVGADLTLKWRPLARSTYRTLIWQTEYIYGRRNKPGKFDLDQGGLYSYLAYQFARTWWVQARYDNLGFPSLDGTQRHRGTALLALVPSEFSAIRLQYAYERGGGERDLQEILLQLNYTMGSHPAHTY